jgi:homocysteine S-methyltransferase
LEARLSRGPTNPFEPIIAQYGLVILDGGLATELERRGQDLNDDLWSAKVLLQSPEQIRNVHLDYFRQGADMATTATYQASLEGLARKGLDRQQSRALFEKALDLAAEARAALLSTAAAANRPSPLIAASLGSYGAFLADGSEYRGNYAASSSLVRELHRSRLDVLIELFGAGKLDVIAFETFPSFPEALIASELIEGAPVGAWMSFSLADEAHISDGTPLEKVVAAIDANPNVLAIGVNCVPPRSVSGALDRLRAATPKPLVVYPNSGEVYDARARNWSGGKASPRPWVALAPEWYEKGARLIGGCCRTTPEEIQQLANWRADHFGSWSSLSAP